MNFATYMGLEVGSVESYLTFYMYLALVLLFVGVANVIAALLCW